MANQRDQRLPRWSTAALLVGGLAGGVIGMALGLWVAGGTSGTTGRGVASTALAAPPGTATPPLEDGQVWRASRFEAQWRQSLARPASLARDEEMAHLLEVLAAYEPARAVALALAEASLELRPRLLAAALRGWAGTAPNDAARWAFQRPFAERASATAAVLAGTACTPAKTLELAAQFVREDPALAHDHGCALVYALARVGEFDAAARFATAGPVANREAWVRTAFTVWAEHQPENATYAAVALSDPGLRTEAFQAAVAGWTATSPSALAEFASRLASAADRTYALRSALGEWVNQDLVAASQWLNCRDASPELDAGAVAVATSAPLVVYRPEVALSWAESVVDVELRSGTIASVLRAWAKIAPADARRYAETSPNLSPADRSAVLADLAAASGS
ncbi:MAG TPA: hypothetical protein VMC06_15165 [Opitutaceae bacterium]|nr:hypothetical protein [Opitutaceae bacterium]